MISAIWVGTQCVMWLSFFLSWLGFVFCPLYILYISTCRYLICIIYSIFFLYLFNTSTPHLLIHFIVIFHPPFTMLLVIVFVPVDFLEWGTGPALGGFDYQHFIRMHSYISNIWIPFHLKSSWRLKRLVYHVHFASLFRLLLGRVIAINLTVICLSSSYVFM